MLGPAPEFPLAAPPPEWLRIGYDRAEDAGLALARADGVLALRVLRPGPAAALVKRVSAPLLAMPYLSWGWRIETAADLAGERPLEIVVGFEGGGRGEPAAPPAEWAALGLPGVERLLRLVWEERGEEAGAARRLGGHGRYAVRGGRAAERRWMLETVDLAALYRRLWPEDDVGAARVALIGVLAAPSARPAIGHVAEIRLSR
ncbi:MAG: DUF3047 domain-containing protein [Proteobacteria bacterium]|nr:DUF3047 domain-containing protein [Pseudomonadota bacterium]